MKFTKLSVIALLLVLCLCVFAACDNGKETDTESNEITETDPVVTDPAGTDPVGTEPVDTDPVDTDPVETNPAGTDPVETDPVTPGHECVGETVTVAATCQAEGSEKTVCKTCGKVLSTKTLPKIDHIASVPETCEEATVCTICKTILKVATACDFDQRVVVAEATCTEKGLVVATCSKCGNIAGVQPPALSHFYESGYASEDDKPTCEKEGTLTYTCSRNGCGDSYTEDVPKLTYHTFEDGKSTVVAPSLLVEGSESGTCTVCGKDTQNVLPRAVIEAFNDMDTSATFSDNLKNSAFATDFTVSPNTKYVNEIIVREDDDLCWRRGFDSSASGTDVGIYIGANGDAQINALSYNSFEISFDFRMDSKPSATCGILSINNRINNKDTRVISYSHTDNALIFSADTTCKLATGIYNEAGSPWIRIRVVVYPITCDYDIYIGVGEKDEELKLTTRYNEKTNNHTVNKYNGGVLVDSQEKSTSSSNAFVNLCDGKVNGIYMLHNIKATVSIDNFNIRVTEFHKCEENWEMTVIKEANCTEDGSKANVCRICGAEDTTSAREPIAATGTHTPNREAATCTISKYCTVCYEVIEASGHVGTTITPATLCTNGSEIGDCSRCDKSINDVIPAGLLEDFENMAKGNLTAAVLNGENSALSDHFTATLTDGYFAIQSEGLNQFIKKTKKSNGSTTLYLVDNTAKVDGQWVNTGLLNTQRFEVSFDFRLDSNPSSHSGVFALNNRDAGNVDEMRVLSISNGGILSFGVPATDTSKYVELATLDYENPKPINIKIVVDPKTVDYEIWLAGTKVFYTETVSGEHKLMLKSGDSFQDITATKDNIKSPDNDPFENKNGIIKGIYMFHYSVYECSIDNFTLRFLDMGENGHVYAKKTEPSTCSTNGKDGEACVVCGAWGDYTELELDETKHTPGATKETSATCTEEGAIISVCTECEKDIKALYTLPKLPHTFTGETEKTDATFTTEGSETGYCKVCQSTQTNVIPKYAVENFDGMTEGALTTEVLNGEDGALAGNFTATVSSASVFNVVADGDNNYVQKGNTSATLYFADKNAVLDSNKFEISFKYRLDANGANSSIISLNNRGTDSNGKREMRILSLNGTTEIVFAMPGNDGTGIAVKSGIDGNAGWISFKIVVDPSTRDYEIWVDGELVLFTTTDSDFTNGHAAWTKNGDGAWTSQSIKNSDQSPFHTLDEAVKGIYMFHASSVSCSIDDLKVTVLESVTASAAEE